MRKRQLCHDFSRSHLISIGRVLAHSLDQFISPDKQPYHLQVREVGRALGDHSWTLVPQRRLFRTADRGLIDVPLCVSSSRTVRTSSTYLEALEKCGLGCLSEPIPVRSLGFVVDIIAAFCPG